MNSPLSAATPLFPPLEPYATHQLAVGDGHTLYVEESGNPNGLPALVLHGGPGGGCNPGHRQRFDPSVWRIICLDQRGCNRSTPPAQGPTHANTLTHLLADLERIRSTFGISRWGTIYGSSWGSTLALAYAQAYPVHVQSLVISAIFLPDEDFTWDWLTHPAGLAQLLPTEYAAMQAAAQAHAPGATGFAMIEALNRAGGSALRALRVYESSAAFFAPDPVAIAAYLDAPESARAAAIQAHYYAHRCFLQPGQLLANVSKIAHLPIAILQGRQDMVCPPVGAHRLHAALQQAGGQPELTLIAACGHMANDAMDAARVAAIQAMAERLLGSRHCEE